MYRITIIIFCLLLCGSTAAYSSEEEHVIPRILVGQVDENQALLGLEMQVEKGWYFYYKDPGDLGIGLSITIDQENKISLPDYIVKKQPIGSDILIINVYDQSVIFPIKIFKPHGTVDITIVFAACDGTVCIPMQKNIKVKLERKQHDKEIMNRILAEI